MLKQITLKQFKEDIKNHQNAFLGVYPRKDFDVKEWNDRISETPISEYALTFRTVAKVQTNAFKFNDGVWLYFDNGTERQAYADGNIRIYTYKFGDGTYKVLVYYIK